MPKSIERDLKADEFRLFHDLIHDRTGIHYPNEKLPLLSNRIRRRMHEVGIDDYSAYLVHVKLVQNKRELQNLIDSITTNETYFFRCARHWDLFRAWVREQAQRPETRKDGFRIWSAAASTGAEAWSILIALEQELGRDFGGLRVSLLGTDLNLAVLDEARAAIYRPYALAQTPPEVVAKYFTKIDEDRYRFEPRLQRHATFRQHNLMDPIGATFDFVFLRNVMIYFDKPSKERVLGHAFAALRPGGRLLVGESESLLNVTHPFSYLKPSLFEKPAPQAQPRVQPKSQPQPR